MIQHDIYDFDDINLIAPDLTFDDIQIECLTDENHSSRATLSSNPIANGANIADNCHREPIELSLTMVVSRVPIETYEDTTHGESGTNRPAQFYNALVKIQDDKRLIEVQTTLMLYRNMYPTYISAPVTSDDGNSITFNIDLKEANIVETQTVLYGKQKPTKATYTKKASRQNNKGKQIQIEQQPNTNSDFLNNNYAKGQSYAAQFGF